MSETIAVLHTAFAFGLNDTKSSVKAAVTFYGDQPSGEIKTNVTRKRGTIVEDDFPALLRVLADFIEQEDLDDLSGLADALSAVA